MYTVLYWINFQNIHNFTYQKNITSYTFLLVFKIVESLPCILKVKKSENGHTLFRILSQTKPSNSSVTLFVVQLLGNVSGDVLNLNFYITWQLNSTYFIWMMVKRIIYQQNYRELYIFSCLNYTKYLVYPCKKPTDLTHV